MMEPKYLILSDSRKLRILWNMNALGHFTKLTGKEMTDFTGKVDVNMLRTIAWCAAREGEMADGRSLDLSEEEFGRLMTMVNIVEFSEILAEQSSGAEKKSPVRGRQPLILFRKRG